MPRPRSINSRFLDVPPASVIGGASATVIVDPSVQTSDTDGVFGTLREALDVLLLQVPDGRTGAIVFRADTATSANIAIAPGTYDFAGRLGIQGPGGEVGANPSLDLGEGVVFENLPWINGVSLVSSATTTPPFTLDGANPPQTLRVSNSALVNTGAAPLFELVAAATFQLQCEATNLAGSGSGDELVRVTSGNLTLRLRDGSQALDEVVDVTAGTILVDRGIDCLLAIQSLIDVTTDNYNVATAAPWRQQTGGGAVQTANYTARPWEIVKYDSSGGTFTITLPDMLGTTDQGTEVIIKNNTADVTAITVAANGAGSIDGAATVALAGARAFLRVISLAPGANNWAIVAN